MAHAANAAGLVVRVVGAIRHCSGAREYDPSDRSLLNHFYAIPVGTLLPLFHSDPTWSLVAVPKLEIETRKGDDRQYNAPVSPRSRLLSSGSSWI